MKQFKLFSLVIILFFITELKGQTFTVSSDSVFTTVQFNSPGGDTTSGINLINTSTNTILLKIKLTFEDLSPNFALIDYSPQFLISNSGIGFTDSISILSNNSINFFGIFSSPSTLPQHKVQILVYNSTDSLNSHQVLTFTSINCTAPATQIIIDPIAQFCPRDSLFIAANNNFFDYQWSNGDTSQTTYVIVDSTLYISVLDSLGCIRKDTIDFDISLPFDESICIVTVDSATNKNIIVWEKTPFERTLQTNIYKETTQAGVYNLIGSVPFDSLSVFIDSNSTPLQNSSRYKISVVDSCGNESTQSPDHKTIHLTASVGTNNENNLVWDGYVGFSFTSYNILRGSTINNMSIIASIQSTLFTFSDLTPLTGVNIYQIEAVRSSACSPTQRSTTFISSSSNNVNLNATSIIDNQNYDDIISVYPNPTFGNVSINIETPYKEVKVVVKDIIGNIVYSNMFYTSDKINFEIGNASSIYFAEITVDRNKIIVKKIINSKK